MGQLLTPWSKKHIKRSQVIIVYYQAQLSIRTVNIHLTLKGIIITLDELKQMCCLGELYPYLFWQEVNR